MSYTQLAFEATIVPEFRSSAVYAVSDTKVYYDTPNGVKIFKNEEEALSYLLSNLDISTKYRFVDAFYNPNYELQKEDGKKYNDYVMVMMRKPAAVNNQFITYMLAPTTGSGELAENLTDEKDFSKLKGLGLTTLMNDKLDDVNDVRDTFIYKENTTKFTCDSLFNHLKAQEKLVRTNFKLVLIDVTGTELKTTDNITVNDSLDIYREFLGGTTHSEEDFEPDTPDLPPDETEINPDSQYI